jgi:hypothetical protein
MSLSRNTGLIAGGGILAFVAGIFLGTLFGVKPKSKK